MSKDVKAKHKKKYDTFSITMELERPLLYDEDDDEDIANYRGDKIKKGIGLFALGILILSVVSFFIWCSNSYKPQELARESLVSDNIVEVEDGDYISFTPKQVNTNKGFIFYPGARVEPESYAPLCRKIAQSGYKVIVLKMPFNFPMLSPNRGEKVIEKYNNIDTWIVGGHSLGGTMAAKFASDNRMTDGVVLIASYPMNDDLKNLGKRVISICGSKDGVINFKKFVDSKGKLPTDTIFDEIEGANHSQFGDYGKQKGDNDAIISQEKQLDITARSIIKFIEGIN